MHYRQRVAGEHLRDDLELVPLIVAALGWAGLSMALGMHGHQPSGPVLFIPRGSYYAAQALFALPLFALQYGVLRRVAAAVLSTTANRLRGRCLSLALFGPLIALWLIPDIVAFAFWGFESLAQVVRISAPVSALGTLALVYRCLARLPGATRRRAFLAALAGCVAQAVVGGAFLR